MKPDDERNPVLEDVKAELLRAVRHAGHRRPLERRLVVAGVAVVALAGASVASAVTRTGPFADLLSASEAQLPVPRNAAPSADAESRCAELKDLADRSPETTVRRVDPRLRDMLAVFRRPQRPTEAVSNCGIELEDGENFRLARGVELPSGEIAFLWPARDAVCYGVAGLGSCPGIEILQRHGVAIGAGYNVDTPAGMMHLSGVARDGVKALAFSLSSGREITTPVVDNAFSVLAPRETFTAERIDDDGSRHALPEVPQLADSAG